jgi:hypothetical protein
MLSPGFANSENSTEVLKLNKMRGCFVPDCSPNRSDKGGIGGLPARQFARELVNADYAQQRNPYLRSRIILVKWFRCLKNIWNRDRAAGNRESGFSAVLFFGCCLVCLSGATRVGTSRSLFGGSWENAIRKEVTMAYQETSEMNRQLDRPQAHWHDWLNAVLAVWLFVSPWVLNFGGVVDGGFRSATAGIAMTAAWNAWIRLGPCNHSRSSAGLTA